MMPYRNVPCHPEEAKWDENEEEDMNDSVVEFLGRRPSCKGGKEDEETLVKIKAVFVDKNSVDYVEKYDKV